MLNGLLEDGESKVISRAMQLLVSGKAFEALRDQIFRFFESLAQFEWGRREMLCSPGFVEFLLDRTSEINQKGLKWKFSIIEKLVAHPKDVEVFVGNQLLIKMQVYLREGVFFKQAEAAVAIADESA